MGNDASKPNQAADVQYLSERFPFDQDEVVLYYQGYGKLRQQRCYQAQEHDSTITATTTTTTASTLFLTQLCRDLNVDFCECLEVVERDILPQDFGQHLERVAFVRPADRSQLLDKTGEEKEDECVRLARLEAFFNGLAICGGNRGTRATLGTLFELCVSGEDHPANPSDLVDANGNEIKAKVIHVLDLAYRLALALEYLRSGFQEEKGTFLPEPDAMQSDAIQSMATSCLDFVHQQRIRRSVAVEDIDDSDLENGFCSKMDFMEWSEATAPSLALILPNFQRAVLFPQEPFPPSLSIFAFPELNEESAFLGSDNSTALFSFACMSKSLGGPWYRLYTSLSDGLSFNRLLNALHGYGGPTLIVVRSSDGCVFGAFTASQWKESKGYFGTSECFLYQLTPHAGIFRPAGKETNYMYCNAQARMQGGFHQPFRGLGFGGNMAKGPRLFIDESFSGCFALTCDETFQKGHLLPRTDSFSQKTFFNIDQLEVWGCGGDDVVMEALECRRKQRSIRASQIQKLRQVDKAAFLPDLRTGLIESKAFGHMDEIHGSTRFQILKRNKDGYN